MHQYLTNGLLLAACSASLAFSAQTKEEDQRPNILVIVTDDHSYQTLGTCE